jgi:hypothetical protein
MCVSVITWHDLLTGGTLPQVWRVPEGAWRTDSGFYKDGL